MNKKKYLVVVHIASRLSRSEMPQAARRIAEAIRAGLPSCEAIATSETCIAAVGLTSTAIGEVFINVARILRPGDNLSVVELSDAVMTSHPGFAQWLVANPLQNA